MTSMSRTTQSLGATSPNARPAASTGIRFKLAIERLSKPVERGVRQTRGRHCGPG